MFVVVIIVLSPPRLLGCVPCSTLYYTPVIVMLRCIIMSILKVFKEGKWCQLIANAMTKHYYKQE